MCSQIHDNWKYHKPKVASYWLVKLDSTKQRKVSCFVISPKTTRSSNRGFRDAAFSWGNECIRARLNNGGIRGRFVLILHDFDLQ